MKEKQVKGKIIETEAPSPIGNIPVTATLLDDSGEVVITAMIAGAGINNIICQAVTSLSAKPQNVLLVPLWERAKQLEKKYYPQSKNIETSLIVG